MDNIEEIGKRGARLIRDHHTTQKRAAYLVDALKDIADE